MATVASIQDAPGMVPPATVAHALHLTSRRIAQLAKEGHIPPSVRGKYHFVKTIQHYVSYLQQRVNGTGRTSDAMRQAKIDLAREQAREKRIANDERQGQLIPLELNLLLIGSAFSQIRSGLLGQHNTIASQYPDLAEDVIDGIRRLNHDLLARLAESRLPADFERALDEATRAARAAADADGEPVG